jgi:hypothetical protein
VRRRLISSDKALWVMGQFLSCFLGRVMADTG